MGDYVIYGNACHGNDACSGTGARIEIWNLADPLNPTLTGMLKDSHIGNSTLAAITKLQEEAETRFDPRLVAEAAQLF